MTASASARGLLFAIALSASAAPAAGERHRVFVAGDSTASAYPPERAPRDMRLSAADAAATVALSPAAVGAAVAGSAILRAPALRTRK